MKYIIVLGDGMADEPIGKLDERLCSRPILRLWTGWRLMVVAVC